PGAADEANRPSDSATPPRVGDEVPEPGDWKGAPLDRGDTESARSRDDSNASDFERVPPGDREPGAADEANRPSDSATPPRVGDEVPEPGDRKGAPLDRGGAEGDGARPTRDRTPALDESPDFLGESDDAEHRSEHGDDDVPTGMYRDADGVLHKFGDRPDSYRDPDGTWHHEDDAAGTYRDDSFRLHDELTKEYLSDPLTNRPYRFMADPGDKQPYTVVDAKIAAQIAETVTERATVEAQRNKANDAVKRHMAEFEIKKISDLAEEKLPGRVEKLEIEILESDLSDEEKQAKLDRLGEMERNAAEFNRLGPLLVKASKTLGELAGRAFGLDSEARPGAILLSPFEGAIDGADTVDIAVLVPGADGGPPKLVVIEAKGVHWDLGGSKVAEAQQGSPEYLRRTAAIDKNLRRILTETPEEMAARGVDPDSAAGRALSKAREQLLEAHRNGTLEVEYHLVHATKNGVVTSREFNLHRDGALVRVDVIGGIESPALARTPARAPLADASVPDADAPVRDTGTSARDTGTPARDADDSSVPPQGGDSDVAAARDAELLGVPGEDEWSHLSPEEVGERLQEHLRDAMRNPDFEVFGFDLDGLNPEVVREYARAMVDLVDRFPSADLRSIGIGGLPPEVIGMAQPRLDASGRMFTESIVLSYDHATGAQAFRDRIRIGVDNGRFSAEVLGRPVRAVVAHEYGHALDHASQQSARHRAEEHLYERYLDDDTRDPGLAFEDWLHQLSGHSFDRDGNLRPEEALPEAFADHVLRGDDEPVSAPARALHDLLTRLAAEPPENSDAPLSLDADHIDLPNDGSRARDPDDSFGRDGDVLFEGDLPDDGTPLYRGIPRLLPDGSVNPSYREAISGRAVPRGTVDLSAEEHISQRRAAESDTTSWSRTRSAAEAFADGDGVILEWRTGAPPEGASWKYKPIFDLPDQFSQVLIQGTLHDARATRFVAADAHPDLAVGEHPGQPAGDPPPPRTPDDEPAAHAPDTELLGAPTDDEWSRLSPAEVGEKLRDDLRRMTDNPQFEVFGFDRDGLNPEAVREIARAMVDLHSRFPQVDIRRIGIGDLPDKAIAEARSGYEDGHHYTESITVSPKYVASARDLRQTMTDRVGDGLYDRAVLRRPAYSIAVHEFGHALESAGDNAARRGAEDQLLDHYMDNHPDNRTMDGFTEWLRDNLSGYSLTSHGIEPSEAMAEALVQVVAHGRDNVAEPVRMLYDRLIDAVEGDAKLLGAPFDDEWSRLGPAEVGEKLRDTMRRITGNAEFEVTGFDRAGLNGEVLREYARSMVEMFERNPQANLRRIVVGELPRGVFAETGQLIDHGTRRVYADDLLINEHYAASATEFRKAVEESVESGWLHSSATRRPVHALAVHEFGHILDISSGGYARRKLDAALLNHYMSKQLGEPTTEGYLAWLKDNLSGYSFDKSGQLNPAEALAEAFAEVRSRGLFQVSEPTRVAYSLLHEAVDRGGRRGWLGRFMDGLRLERFISRDEPGGFERDAVEAPQNSERHAVRADDPRDGEEPRRRTDAPPADLTEPVTAGSDENGARDLVRPDEAQPAGWHHRPTDVAAAEVREVLVRSEIGRQALTRLRDLGAAIRFEEPGDGPGQPDGFDGRTMEVFIGTRGRDQLAQAAAVVRAAELAGAVAEGRLEVNSARIRALDRADHVAARVRVEAEALGRQAEFHREMREAGYDPYGGPVRDVIDAAQRSALESAYLDVFDRAVEPDGPVDDPARRAIRYAEAARLTARRDAAAAAVDAARALRAEAARGLADDGQLSTRAALADTMEQLHGRTIRIDQASAWRDRLSELERASLRVIDLEEVRNRADADLRRVLDLDARQPQSDSGVDSERRRAAGVAELLADPRFDAPEDPRKGVSGRHEAGEEWDAAHRSPEGAAEYAPPDLATARELDRLQRAEAAARRELARIEADWDRAFRRLQDGFNLPDDEIPSTRQEKFDLVRERSERIDIWNGTSHVLLLADLTAQHTRATTEHARVLGEITDIVRRDLSDRAALAGEPPPTDIRVRLDESGDLHVLRDAADAPAPADPPRHRVGEGTHQRTITEHAAALRNEALVELSGSRQGRWAAAVLERLGVDIRFSAESEASIRRMDSGRYGLRPDAGYNPVTNTVVLESDAGSRRHAAELVRAARLAEQMNEAAGEPLARLTLSRDEYVDLMLDRMAEAYALMYAGNADDTGMIDPNRIGVDDLERAYGKAYGDALRYAEKTYWKSGVVRSFPLYHRAAFRAGVRAVREHLNHLGPHVDWRDYGDHFGAAWDRAHGIAPTERAVDADAQARDSRARAGERATHVALEIESLRMLRDLGEYVPVSPAERAYTEAYDKAYPKAEKAHRRNPEAPPPEQAAHRAGREAVRRYLDRVGLDRAEIALDVVRAAGNEDESRWGHPQAREDGIAPRSEDPATREIGRDDDAELARRVLDQEFDGEPHPERLTDRVARYPADSEPGRRPRLVVVAEPGQHIDALRELAANHPELADVLWDRSHYLDYREAVRGAGGLPTMHHITVTVAEGPYRHPSRTEALTEMLAHYLRYRAEGRTHLGFEEWLRQLGPDAFYTAEDAEKARGTSRQGLHVPGRLTEGFHEAGHRTAADADPPLTPPHPAEVAHRLYTRRIALPSDSGIPRPSHHELEIFRVGSTVLSIHLEPDGNGGWRVPAPLSNRSESDVLSTHLQGLAAPDRKKLVARIIELLGDGSTDLADRAAPRSRFGRFIDRLTPGRASTPEGEQPHRVERSGNDDPHVDRDRMADESPRGSHPPEDIAADAPDTEVLGAATADEWSQLSPHEVGELLRDQLREATGNPGFEVFGFDRPGLNPEVVREYARAMVEMHQRFPPVDLRGVGIGELKRGELGWADGQIDDVTKKVFTRAIVLSHEHATSARDFRAAVHNAVGNDQLKPMMLRRPVFAVAVHEYGHVLDHAGGLAARMRAERHLLELAAADPDGDFGEWLRELSGYSLDEDGLLDDHEAVAEAFAEVVLRDHFGDLGPASKPIRALHDLLLHHAEQGGTGRAVDAPTNDRLVLDTHDDQVRALLRQTDYGKQILASLDSGPIRTGYEDTAPDGRTGEFRRRELSALAFTAGNSHVRQALALAHESLHAQRHLQRTTANTPERIRAMSRDEFVDAMVDEEAAASGRHFRLAAELRALGYEIAEHPLEEHYREAFDRELSRRRWDNAGTRTEAHDLGVAALREPLRRTEWNNGRNYADYYGNIWDEANVGRDGAAEAGRHHPFSPTTADELWHGALTRQDARLRAREAAAEFARRAEALFGTRDVARSTIDRALREAEDAATRSDHDAESLRRQHDLRALSDAADLRDQAGTRLEGQQHSLAASAARGVLGAAIRGEPGARVLTDHVAHVPGEPDRLVIAAEAGDHERVMREAERDPFAAALLGRDDVDRRFLEVEIDDFGRVRVRSVDEPRPIAPSDPVGAVTPRDLAGTAAAERTARLRAELARTEIGRQIDRALTEHKVRVEYESDAPDRYYPAQRRLVLDPGLTDTQQILALVRGGTLADLAHAPDMPDAARLRTQSSRRAYVGAMLDLETAARIMQFAVIGELRAARHEIPETELERVYTEAYDAAHAAARAAEPNAWPEDLQDKAREAAFEALRPLMDAETVGPDRTHADFYGDAWDAAHGTRSFDQVVADALASGEIGATLLREGDSAHSARSVELVRFANGTELIRKIVVNPRHAVAEVLTGALGRAVDAPVPESVLHEPNVVYQQVMPGEPAGDRHRDFADPHELGYADSIPGRALGLLDTVVRPPDRDRFGWLAGPDRQLAGIDHSRAFENSAEARDAVSPFAEGFLARDADGNVRYRDNELTREAVDILIERVAALRPQFERYGRTDWHDLAMERLARIREHARDIAPVPPPDAITPVGDDHTVVREYDRRNTWLYPNGKGGIHVTVDTEGVLRVHIQPATRPADGAGLFRSAMSEFGHLVTEIRGEWHRDGGPGHDPDLYRTPEETMRDSLLGELAAEHGFTEIRVEAGDPAPTVRFSEPEFADADTHSTPDATGSRERVDDNQREPAADDAADQPERADSEVRADDLWQLSRVDAESTQVWQVLEQSAVGREAAELLRAEGARVRFADLGDEIGAADVFDRRTMDIRIDTHDRGQVELAGELVRVAALTEAIRAGQVEVTPSRIRGMSREDYVSAQLRADAVATGRQAEFLRELENAGYPGRPTALAPVEVEYQRAVRRQYLEAYDAAVARAQEADPAMDADRLRERGREAGVEALLAGDLFDPPWSAEESASARSTHGRDWDAAQHHERSAAEYRPATAEAARETQDLVRRHAAHTREIGRIDAMRDELVRKLDGFDPEHNALDRRALAQDRADVLAHLRELARTRRELGDDQLATFDAQVRVLSELAADRGRAVAARDDVALELAARVGHDLMDRQVREAGGSWLTDRVAWLPGRPPKVFVAETGDRFTRVTGDEAPDTSLRHTLVVEDVVADRVWVDVDDSGAVRLRHEQTDPSAVRSEDDGHWMRERTPNPPDDVARPEPPAAEEPVPADHLADRLDRVMRELDGDNLRVYQNMRGERVRGDGNSVGRWAMSTVDRLGVDIRFTFDDPPAARDGRQQLRSDSGYVPSADSIVLHSNSSALELAEAWVHAAAMAEQTRVGDGPLERLTLSRDEYVGTMLDRQAEAHARAFEFARVREERAKYQSERERTPDEPRTVEHDDRLRETFDEARKKARKIAARAYRDNSSVRPSMLDAAAYRAAVREVRAALVERGPLIDGVDYATHYAAEWDRANGFTAADLDHAPRPHKADSPELRRMRTGDFAVEIETLRVLRESGRFVPVGPAEAAYTHAYDRAYRKASHADDGVPPERRALDAGLTALRKYVDKVGLPEAEITMEVARSAADNHGRYQPWPMADDAAEPARHAPVEADDSAVARRTVNALLDRDPAGVRLTERIALFTGERGVHRLVIVAQPGGHIDALRELAVRNSAYAEVLWSGTHRLDYLAVSPDDGGTRWLPAGVAEGPYRAPDRYETMQQFLAHYLRYREAGRTGLGFEAWLRQLGPEMFHTKQDQREADAHEAYEGRQNKGSLRHDALTNFRTEPEAGEPHPAVVAHRLATRQVPLPEPGSGPGVSWPRTTVGSIEIADYSFGIVLEADGNGGWRVPAPTGDGGLDDAFGRLFHGMSDSSVKKLVKRISRLLGDGGSDLVRREPRGALRRMADRLSFGSRDDAPRSIDAGETEHNPPQFDRPRTHDPDQARRAEADRRQAVLDRLAAQNHDAVRERDAARAADDPKRLARAEERVERLDRAMATALERDALLRADARPVTDRVGILAGEPPMVLVVNLGGTDPAHALADAAAGHPEVADALARGARPRELRVDPDGTIRVMPIAPRADAAAGGESQHTAAGRRSDGPAEPGESGTAKPGSGENGSDSAKLGDGDAETVRLGSGEGDADVKSSPGGGEVDSVKPGRGEGEVDSVKSGSGEGEVDSVKSGSGDGDANPAKPASGDGGAEKPPTTPRSADEPGDEPGPPSDWYFRMRIEQADWEADMAADHAAWLREQADANPDDRWARLRAEQAEWNARMAADRAAWLRLEQAENETWSATLEADRMRRIADADPDDPWAELHAQQAEWNARMAEDRAQWLRTLYAPIGSEPHADSATRDSAASTRTDSAPSSATPETDTPPLGADGSRTGGADDDPRARMSPETRAQYDRLATELEQAQARRDELRSRRDELAGRLPIDDADDWAALRPGPDGLDRTLEELRGRTMPVSEMPERLARIDELEQTARDFADADAETARLETQLADLELSTTPVGEYDRLVQQRQALTREREFWRAKREDRAARCESWGDSVVLDESALRGDQLETTVLRLYEAANVRTVDDVGGPDDAPHTDRVAPEPLELEHRRRTIEKLAAAAEQVNQLDERIQQVDRRIDELRRAGVGAQRSRPQDVIDALEGLAQQRADALREVKPLRHERDDLAARLGLLDPEGRVDQAACEPERLDRTVADLRAAVRDGLADGTLSEAEADALRRDIDALDAVAREVNDAHNAIGRIQDDMARVAGAYRDFIERVGGRMVTDRVGIIDGERPRIIVFGARPDPSAPRADHDAALADALRRSSDVAQAIVRPETTVDYRHVLADRDDNVRTQDMDPPEIERLSTGWIGGRRLDITSWRDADGVWHRVDPTRPDWEFGRDRSEPPKKYSRKELPDGVSGWAMEDVVNDITLPTDDVPPGMIPESTLPLHMPQAPSRYDTSGVDEHDVYTQHWGGDSYNVVRLLLMAAQVPKHPAVKAWIQRHPEIGEWVQARPWLRHVPPFGTVFRNYEWFAPPQRNIQPMHRPWNAADHVPPGDRVDIPEGLRREWDRDVAAWQRVQDWADGEYERFLADDTDIDRIADGLDRHRRAEQETRAREVVDAVARLVRRQPGIDPLGDVDAQLGRIHDEIDRMAADLADRFAAEDPDAIRDTVEDIRELVAGGGDPDDIATALAEHMRDDVPVFTREELARIKDHLMVDEHRVREHSDPAGRYTDEKMDRLADVAEAWQRLIDGVPLSQDFVLLDDMLAEARFLDENPLSTWQQANAHAITLGYHWDADRPPLTDWRTGIPYAPAPLAPDPGYLPPASGATPSRPHGPTDGPGEGPRGGDRRPPAGEEPSRPREEDESSTPNADGGAQKPPEDPPAPARPDEPDEPDDSGDGEQGAPRTDRPEDEPDAASP
ncbi:hypothetical protein ABZ824_20660, partial [Nocardia sp. NPDC047038]